MKYDLVVRSQHVITEIGDRPAAVAVKDGKIAKVGAFDEVLDAEQDITSTNRGEPAGKVSKAQLKRRRPVESQP